MALLATFIGIDNHLDPTVRDLFGACRDATALWSLFSDTVPNLDAKLLVDNQATIAAIRLAIQGTLGAAGPDDTVILSFSGHGTRDHRLVAHDTLRTNLAATTLPMLELAEAYVQLERSTVKQIHTWTDLQYQQVLDNLAMFCKNRSAMPYFSVAGTGVTQVSDNGNVSGGFLFHPFLGGDLGGTLGGTAARQIAEQWSLATTSDPGRLDVIRCLYRMSTGTLSPIEHDACVKTIRDFYNIPKNPKPDQDWPRLDKIKSGWFTVGCKKEVPRDACYVGHYCDLYVWVTPDGLEQLTELSLAVLDIATADPAPSVIEHYDVAKCKQGYYVKRYVCRAANPPCDTDPCITQKTDEANKLLSQLGVHRDNNNEKAVKSTAQEALNPLRDLRSHLKSQGIPNEAMEHLDAVINGLENVQTKRRFPQGETD